MKPLKRYYKCPHCGRTVKEKKDIDNEMQYTHECLHCDEDLYLFEVLIIK